MTSQNIFTLDNINGCVWNILARGLSHGEFHCPGGDVQSTIFGKRFPKIIKMMNEMFKSDIDFISTIENDHPEYIAENLDDHIKMLKVLKYPENFNSNAKKIGIKNYSDGLGVDKRLIAELKKHPAQNDTLSIYYNSRTLQPIPIENHSLFTQFVIKDDQTLAGFVVFHHIPSNKIFGLVTAHLSSGETSADSSIRLQQCNKIIDFIKHNCIPKYPHLPIVITMDSNSSPYYQSILSKNSKTLSDDVLQFFQTNGYENGVSLSNVCYKLRHGSGAQPDKFGELMFDSIDRIFFSSQIKHFQSMEIRYFCSFKPVEMTLSADRLENIKQIRLTSNRREHLKSIVTGDRDQGLLPWSDKVGMGKNMPTGSKIITKKGVKTTVPLYNGTNYKGDIKLNEHSFTELGKIECLELYPNINNPSDHPPCICSFKLTQ
jgi:hypothetical protein